MKSIFSKIIIPVLIGYIYWNLCSCANIIPPSGGPKDSIAPRIVLTVPKDSALNVKANKIVLTFDEFITLQNINEQLIVSPYPKNLPLVDSKLQNLTIKLRDSLEKNTTYSFDFGNAIKDVNEGNIAKNLHFAFSTGNKLDQNQYSGWVYIAETGKTDSTLIVVLHNNAIDSSIQKNRPRYYTKVNSKGFFNFTFLPEGQFSAYVVPGDFTKKYDDSTKMFAFLNHQVLINNNTKPDTLYAYQEYKKIEQKTTGTSTSGNTKSKPNPEDKKLKFTSNLELGGVQDLLSPLVLEFSKPLKTWDSAGIILCDTLLKPVQGYSISIDTSFKKISVDYPWKEKQFFKLILSKEAFIDTNKNKLSKADTLRIITKREAEYGSVRLRFTNFEIAKHPVIQFIVDNKIIESYTLSSKEFVKKKFKPGEYECRILYDENQNGKWDPGSFRSKKQPELVKAFSKKIVVRADRDTDQTLVL